MRIETSRLTLREAGYSDANAILSAVRCPQVSQMHGDGFTDIDRVRDYIGVLRNEYSGGKYRTLAFAAKETDLLLGMMTLDRDGFFPRAEISYWIDEAHRNRGYTTEAVIAFIRYGFETLKLNRVQAILSDNPASGRVLEKAGMTYEGTLRQFIGMGDTHRDCRMYSVLKSEVGREAQ